MVDQRVKELLRTIPPGVRVVAVSKFQPASKIRALYQEAGLRDFGENYVQEAQAKREELSDLNLHWHFIGRLQKNKAKQVVGSFSLIHSVDSLELARLIDRLSGEKGIRQKILLQVNLAGEITKGGFSRENLTEALPALQACQHLSVAGFMTMPPLTENPEESRVYFRELRELKNRWGSEFPNLSILSMGTSHDFRVAIEEGATLVRLGTVLFGERPKKI